VNAEVRADANQADTGPYVEELHGPHLLVDIGLGHLLAVDLDIATVGSTSLAVIAADFRTLYGRMIGLLAGQASSRRG
jgi:hypothetical protein